MRMTWNCLQKHEDTWSHKLKKLKFISKWFKRYECALTIFKCRCKSRLQVMFACFGISWLHCHGLPIFVGFCQCFVHSHCHLWLQQPSFQKYFNFETLSWLSKSTARTKRKKNPRSASLWGIQLQLHVYSTSTLCMQFASAAAILLNLMIQKASRILHVCSFSDSFDSSTKFLWRSLALWLALRNMF